MDDVSTAVAAAAALATALAARAFYRARRSGPDDHAADDERTRATRALLDAYDLQHSSKPEAAPRPAPEHTVIFTFVAAAPPTPPGHAPWHPILGLAQLDGRRTHMVVLIHTPDQLEEAERLSGELRIVHDVPVMLREVAVTDLDDVDQVSEALGRLADEYEFDSAHYDYLLHLGAGTPAVHSCLTLMAQRRQIPAQLLFTRPPWESATPHRVRSADLGRPRVRIEVDEGDLDPLLRSRNPDMQALLAKLELRARLNVPLTFLGETGTGKTELAKLAHKLKVEHLGLAGPLVHRNCASLKGDIARSMLFGHKRGAFSGAVSDQLGWLLEANGGTLFLDEFVLMGAEEQGLFLAVLDDHMVTPIGASKPVQSHFQLVVATNLDIDEEVRAGRLRADLRQRLGPAVFRLPPLRERTEDMEPTLTLALRKASAIIRRQITMTPEASSMFLAYATSSEARWSGNFREYSGAVLEMGMEAQTTGVITAQEVRDQIGTLRHRWRREGVAVASHASLDALLPPRLRTIDFLDKVVLVEMIRACQAAPTLAAAGRALFDVSCKELGRSNNAGDRLSKSLKAHGLTFERIKAGRIE